MPISLIKKMKCPECGADFIETSRLFDMITGKCGHIIFSQQLDSATSYDIVSSDGKKPRPYQIEGIQFVEKANVRALIADEQGLGKTIQAIGTLKLHPELLPAVIVTKTTIKHQWFHEIIRWCGQQGFVTQVINSSKEFALPGLDVYITTYDLCKKESVFAAVKGSIKTVIIDECQAIKNHLSDRAKAIQTLTTGVDHVIALSGTPIKNNAGEYFTILNILHPERFPAYQPFLDTFCDYYWNGYGTKVGGLANPEYFREQTDDFIIRRTRKEVAPEIPEVDRQFFHCELSKQFHGAYRDAMKELDELLYADENENTNAAMIAIMTKMRKITGLSKVPHAIEYTEEFIENQAPDKKLVIFCHHHDVVTLLKAGLEPMLKQHGWGKVLDLNAQIDGAKRAELVDQFRTDPISKVMVASTLAAGEGLNLQFVDDAIMLERQWNPANEEQAEGRFARIGRLHADEPITIVYMIADGCIDEYFTELVEQKRSIVKGTLDGEATAWDQNSLMKDLAGILLTKGKERWHL